MSGWYTICGWSVCTVLYVYTHVGLKLCLGRGVSSLNPVVTIAGTAPDARAQLVLVLRAMDTCIAQGIVSSPLFESLVARVREQVRDWGLCWLKV